MRTVPSPEPFQQHPRTVEGTRPSSSRCGPRPTEAIDLVVHHLRRELHEEQGRQLRDAGANPDGERRKLMPHLWNNDRGLGIPMNAPRDNTAAQGLRGWWLSPPRAGMQRLINPWKYRRLRAFGVMNIAGGIVATGIGAFILSNGAYGWTALFLVIGALNLVGGCWAPRDRSLRICLNLRLVNTRRGDVMPVLADSSVSWSPGHAGGIEASSGDK